MHIFVIYLKDHLYSFIAVHFNHCCPYLAYLNLVCKVIIVTLAISL